MWACDNWEIAFGLALEALPHLFGGRQVCRQDLDRDRPVEARVHRPVDLSHPPRSQERENLVGTQARTRCQRQCGCRISARASWRESWVSRLS